MITVNGKEYTPIQTRDAVHHAKGEIDKLVHIYERSGMLPSILLNGPQVRSLQIAIKLAEKLANDKVMEQVTYE